MKLKSKIIRILYFSDNKSVEGKDKIIKLLKNELNENVDEKSVSKAISSINNYGLISINNKSQCSVYYLTENGVNRVENLLTGSDIEEKIKEATGKIQYS